jgi:primosomal protein N' (replication factor Y)
MADNSILIDVAAALPLDGPFTYRASAELAHRAQIGRRVLAPFRNKVRAGFIVGFPQNSNLDKELREIIDIPDEPPYFDENWWKFICWMSGYYLLPKGLALKTALPPGSDRKSKPWALLTSEGRKWFGRAEGPEDLELPSKLLKNGSLQFSELIKAIGDEQAQRALKKGWILKEERIAKPRISLWKKKLPELLNTVSSRNEINESQFRLTPHQQSAYSRIEAALDQGSYSPFLLFGVTGSGKTEVYLRAIRKTLEMGKKVIALAPEIALTPQLAQRFLERLGGGVSLFHSGLTPGQRLDEWRRMRLGAVDVVIGARSGIFAPFNDIGLIIVDEEHDPSYKQEDSCPYNARDMAMVRAKLENCAVILGSATPSFETFVNAQNEKITRLDLPSRQHGLSMPKVEIVDLKDPSTGAGKDTLLTDPLVREIRDSLAADSQVIIFLNRRGFDTYAICKSCGHPFKCPNCDVSLTHHKRIRALRCHMCGYSRAAPPLCPECSGERIFFGGIGAQKIQEQVLEIFPEARVERLDRDSTRKHEELQAVLDRFRNREIDILIGTQMIVKGHDFPGIGLVGVLCGDQSLHFPDFRASERTFQLLTQVSGRTGREDALGKALVQTYDPEHYAIRLASTHSYEQFFELESEIRRELAYPPYGHLILIKIEGNNEKRVENQAMKIGRTARMLKSEHPEVVILGPAPAPVRKIIGKYRWQALLKCRSRGPLREMVTDLMDQGYLKGHGFKIIVDVDPVDLL